MFQVGEVDGVLAEIVSVVCFHEGKFDLRAGMEIKPLLAGIHGDVRTVEADTQQERLVVALLEFIDRPVRGFGVRHLGIVVREHAPIPEWMSVRLGEFLCGTWSEAAIVSAVFLEELFVVTVKDFSHGHGSVTVLGKVFG